MTIIIIIVIITIITAVIIITTIIIIIIIIIIIVIYCLEVKASRRSGFARSDYFISFNEIKIKLTLSI